MKTVVLKSGDQFYRVDASVELYDLVIWAATQGKRVAWVRPV